MTALRIFLCDDVPELRALLRFALEEDPELVVVGESGDAPGAVAQITDLQPDAVLLDLSMPGMDGLEAIPRIRDVAPRCAIVVFSGFAADRMRPAAIGQGADDYLEKGEPFEVVRHALREAVDRRAA